MLENESFPELHLMLNTKAKKRIYLSSMSSSTQDTIFWGKKIQAIFETKKIYTFTKPTYKKMSGCRIVIIEMDKDKKSNLETKQL